jgi:hypothetical protein
MAIVWIIIAVLVILKGLHVALACHNLKLKFEVAEIHVSLWVGHIAVGVYMAGSALYFIEGEWLALIIAPLLGLCLEYLNLLYVSRRFRATFIGEDDKEYVEHPLLLQLAGLMDNPRTTIEQQQYTFNRILENDLEDLRNALLDAYPDAPRQHREAIQGPLPTRAETDRWIEEWGYKYEHLIKSGVTQ